MGISKEEAIKELQTREEILWHIHRLQSFRM